MVVKMTMLEKMARAMRGAAEVEDGPGGPMIVNPEEMARAALLAIREPDEAMVGPESDAWVRAGSEAENVWRFCIDAILNEAAPQHPAPQPPPDPTR